MAALIALIVYLQSRKSMQGEHSGCSSRMLFLVLSERRCDSVVRTGKKEKG
jgi:hypothetical protein